MSRRAIAIAIHTIKSTLQQLSEDERAEVIATINAMRAAPSDERARIESALAATGDCVKRAANVLGISRSTLQRRMSELGFEKRKAGRPRRASFAPL